MREQGADLIDIGGESTRPGALEVSADVELARIAPVVAALRAEGGYALSLDTRKASVARAVDVDLINDVSGFTHDPDLAEVSLSKGLPVCLMHAQGTPQTMQNDPSYDDVLLDVYDWLAKRITDLERLGLEREQIIVDPGIGFGKSQEHNLMLLKNLSLFHGLGTPILLGVSRKGFIGRIGNAPDPMSRAPGSIAVGLAAIAQGVQILRVHDVAEHVQAIALWRACMA
jgi:dihydropteroate synthase